MQGRVTLSKSQLLVTCNRDVRAQLSTTIHPADTTPMTLVAIINEYNTFLSSFKAFGGLPGRCAALVYCNFNANDTVVRRVDIFRCKVFFLNDLLKFVFMRNVLR